MRENFETGLHGTASWVVGRVDYFGNASLDHGAGAHGAGFKRYVESCASEAIVSEDLRGFADDDDFGVRGGVVVTDRAIAALRKDFVFVNQERPDGNFSGRGGGAGFFEGQLHEFEIGWHGKLKNNMRGGRDDRNDSSKTSSILAASASSGARADCLTRMGGGKTLRSA